MLPALRAVLATLSAKMAVMSLSENINSQKMMMSLMIMTNDNKRADNVIIMALAALSARMALMSLSENMMIIRSYGHHMIMMMIHC